MSREDDLKAAEGFATKYHDIELIRSEPKLFRYGVNTFMAGISYGRSTPDREMLKRLISHWIVLEWRAKKLKYNPKNVDVVEFVIDEFLTLENQRGDNGSR